MHGQNDYYFSKMINKKYKRCCITQSFGIMRYFNQKWGKQVENKKDCPCFRMNATRTHDQGIPGIIISTVFLIPSGTRLVHSLHHKTSHYITSHAYTYTHALCLIF